MKSRTFWIVAIAAGLVACGKEPPAEQDMAAPEEATPAQPAAVTDPAPENPEFDQRFIDGMHARADKMDELAFALDDGDLEAASVPAYWLWRYNIVNGIPEEWQIHVTGMREAARAVENATTIEEARAAAESITKHCQDCHAAAGVLVNE